MNKFWKPRATALAISIILLVALLAVAAAGCGGNTPSSAARDMVQMLSDRQFGEAYDSFSSASPVREIQREDFISQMEASLPDGTTISEFSVTEEKIDGDKATVAWKAKVKMPNEDEQDLDDSFSAVKEDDTWMIEQ
ncbi:MAG: NTF2-like N-terminal transpeptidase domain-containing protein [Thermoleophilia bacterium]|nr:NTF2-like N-terminal transpeptidase domain-containing protein [Thermoleophilia bacterium]